MSVALVNRETDPVPDLSTPFRGGRLVELDGLRGLAVLFILIWHYVAIPLGLSLQPDRWLPTFPLVLIIFKSGVDLFFVLSGFLIAGILIDHRRSPSYYRVFFIRRFCRIFPLYYALVLVFVIARAWGVDGLLFAGSIPLASYLTMTQNYFMASAGTYGAAWLGATWSLAIEEQFYLLFPFLVRRARDKLPYFLGAAVVLAPILRIGCYIHFGNDWAAYTWLPCRFDSLCWGALVAWLLRRPNATSNIARHPRVLSWIFAGLLAGAGFLMIALPRNIGYHMTYWGHTLLAALYAMTILLAVLYTGHPRTTFLRSAPLLFLGRISYGIYLLHGIVLIALFSAMGRAIQLNNLPNAGLIALALGLTLVVSMVFYRWLEQPFLRLGQRANFDLPSSSSPK